LTNGIFPLSKPKAIEAEHGVGDVDGYRPARGDTDVSNIDYFGKPDYTYESDSYVEPTKSCRFLKTRRCGDTLNNGEVRIRLTLDSAKKRHGTKVRLFVGKHPRR
jgi:hypothetical protein